MNDTDVEGEVARYRAFADVTGAKYVKDDDLNEEETEESKEPNQEVGKEE